MAAIKIDNLSPVGSELFQDSESFLNELTDREMGHLLGGKNIKSVLCSVVCCKKDTVL